jgi:hypothetical protein
MRFGFVVPHASAREFTEVAVLGEEHGWDGVFTWEAVWGDSAWVTLGAAAMVTSRIRLGTLLTPASRWRPWDLASAVGTVDRLSGGRAVMSVGLGAPHDGWTAFEADEGRRARAQKVDECLAVYDGLMRGQPFSYQGTYYTAKPTDHFVPDPPVQRPRPPVWVVGARVTGRAVSGGSGGSSSDTGGAPAIAGTGPARQRSLERAARWDGLLPAVIDGGEPRSLRGPDELASLVAEVTVLRAAAGKAGEPYDVIIEADSTGQFEQLEPNVPGPWEAAGATWWVESWWTIEPGPEGLAEVRRRVAAGPPR